MVLFKNGILYVNAQSLEDRCHALSPIANGNEYERCTLIQGHLTPHLGTQDTIWTENYVNAYH